MFEQAHLKFVHVKLSRMLLPFFFKFYRWSIFDIALPSNSPNVTNKRHEAEKPYLAFIQHIGIHLVPHKYQNAYQGLFNVGASHRALTALTDEPEKHETEPCRLEQHNRYASLVCSIQHIAIAIDLAPDKR